MNKRIGPVGFGHCVIVIKGRIIPWFCLFPGGKR